MTGIDTAWLDARIAATQALILAYEAAILAIGNGVQSYTLDTGQSRQVVTRADLGTLNAMLNSLMNRYATLDARRNGSHVFVDAPGW